MKTKTPHRTIFTCAILCYMFISQLAYSQDKLINILDEEVQREIHTLKQQETPAYYIAYRVDEIRGYSISSSFGSLTNSNGTKMSRLTVTVRVGSPQLDNYHPLRGSALDMSSFYSLPAE